MNKLDKIVLNTSAFAIILLWINYIVDELASAVFVSFLIFLLLRVLFIHLINRYRDKKNITVWEMSQSFAIMGAESVCAHLIKVIPEIYRPYIENNCILYEKNGAKTLIAPLFKFGNVSNDEIAKIWRYAQTKEIDKIYLLARAHQRSGVQLANCLKGDIEFVQPRSLHKFLIKHNALPQKNFKYKKSKRKIDFKDALSNILIRKRAKYFLFSGIFLAVFSYFSPLIIYYLIMATISLSMSVACLVYDR